MKKIKNNKVIGTGKLSDKDAKFLEELNRRGQAPEEASSKMFNYLKKMAAGKKSNVRAELKAVLKNKKKNPGVVDNGIFAGKKSNVRAELKASKLGIRKKNPGRK